MFIYIHILFINVLSDIGEYTADELKFLSIGFPPLMKPMTAIS